MTKYAFLIPTMIALMTAFNAKEATAQGIHFRSGGIHVDVGHVHHGHRHHGYYGRRSHGGHRRGLSDFYGGWGGHRHWHDTTHLDYHPGYFVRHYDHYDYVPGQYDVHYDGHWDYYHF